MEDGQTYTAGVIAAAIALTASNPDGIPPNLPRELKEHVAAFRRQATEHGAGVDVVGQDAGEAAVQVFALVEELLDRALEDARAWTR